MHRQRMSTTRLRPPSNLSRSPPPSAQLFTLVQTHGRAPETSIHARHARTGQVGQQSVRRTSNLTFGPLRRIHRLILGTRRSASALPTSPGDQFAVWQCAGEPMSISALSRTSMGPLPSGACRSVLPGARFRRFSAAIRILFALGPISSYLLFAIGWVSFGVASLRARVFPVWISVFIVIGRIAGYQALLSPWGHSPWCGHCDTWWLDAARSFRGHHGFKRWSS
jgi:hypothetical protein